MRRFQRGDAGAAMVVLMVVMMVGLFWYGGWHGDGGHMSGGQPVERQQKSALELLDEAYARGEITRDEYLQRRADLLKR
jgi:putative membrane protein